MPDNLNAVEMTVEYIVCMLVCMHTLVCMHMHTLLLALLLSK